MKKQYKTAGLMMISGFITLISITTIYTYQITQTIMQEKLHSIENLTEKSALHMETHLESLIDEIISLFPENLDQKAEKQIADFDLDLKKLFPIGIIVNELLTNIMKYAFTSRDSGYIEVTLIKMLTTQLEGNLTVENHNGTRSVVKFCI